MLTDRPYPIVDERSRQWFDAAARGVLLFQRCRSCGHQQFYPRAHCVRCFTPEPEWIAARGTGRLHTFTIVRKTPNAGFAEDCPYVFAIVELDEGVHLTSRVVDVPLEQLRCEMRLRVRFDTWVNDIVMPVFTLPEGE